MKHKHTYACLFMFFSPLIFIMAMPRIQDVGSRLWQSYNWLLDDHFTETVLVLGCTIWMITLTFVGLGLLYVA